MADARLTGSDKRSLLFWIALGILGIVFAQKFYFRAFPEASVNFKVTREEALNRAKSFVASLGENVSGYQSTAVFSVDDQAKVYLERELGLQQANHLMSGTLHIWYWDIRFFKPQQEEEFNVRISPSGEIVGYDHKIEESRKGAQLDRESAQASATAFLVAKLATNLDDWEFLPEEANSKTKPARTDWDFTWEKRAFRAKDAPYRYTVTIQGDKIGGAEQYLKVPEAWTRSFQQLRSSNDFLTQIAILPYVLLLGAAVWLAVVLSKRGQTSWGLAIKLGIFVAVLLFLMQLNTWPVEKSNYDTNTSYGSFVLEQLAKALLFGLSSVITITLVLPGAEPLYRSFLPGKLRLSQAFTLRGLRTKEFFSSAVVGISMAAFHIGFVVAFYVVATHFGAWAPQDLNYENSINTIFPWIAGVAIGFLASTNEEFTFRLFAIPFIHRLTGSRFLAVLIPAFCWSFLHANYPQEPPYIRGIEIGLIGIVAGLVMLRWGILATLIWHYTVDASLVGLFLLRSNSLYFKISGVIVATAAVAPLAFAAVSYLSRGKFEDDEDLLNGAEPAAAIDFRSTEPAAVAEHSGGALVYRPLAPAVLAVLIFCTFAGAMLVWRGKSSAHSIGGYLQLSVDARGAKLRADEILRQHKIDPASYHSVTLMTDRTDRYSNEFLHRQMTIEQINAIYAGQIPGALWRIRYFRDSQPEEFRLFLKPDGSLHSFRHTLAEGAPGESLPKEQAVAIAEKYLREEKKIELSQWKLVESTSDKKPKRIDHSLTWQQNLPLNPSSAAPDPAKDAFARITVQIFGNEVGDYSTEIKIPDEWRRQQEETTLPRAIFSYVLPVIFILGFGIAILVIFLKNLRSDAARSVPWKRLGFWASWSLLAYLVNLACGSNIANALNTYQTAIPFKTMIGTLAVGFLLGIPFYFGAFALLFSVAWYFGTVAFGRERLPSWLGMPSAYYRDALAIGLGGSAVLAGLQHLFSSAAAPHTTTLHRSMESSFAGFFDAVIPAASIFATALIRGLLYTGGLALVASFVLAYVRPTWLKILLFLVATLSAVGSNWIGPLAFAKQWTTGIFVLGIVILAVRYLMHLNILGCFLLVASTTILGAAGELLRQPDHFYRVNAFALLAALALLFLWPVVLWRTRAADQPV